LSSSPDRATPPARRRSIDWARGLAVLIMIQAHVLDAWTLPSDRSTTAFHVLNILSGFAAPLFLWLAGVALVLAGEREWRRTGDRRAAWHALVRRGLEIFVLAFAFRLQAFLFNPGGDLIALFRVDILNVMGLGLTAGGLLWGAIPSRGWQPAVFAIVATFVAMVAPAVTTAGWIDALPVWCQWYIRPAGEHTVFTLFPWVGFVFAGSAAGALTAALRDPAAEHRRHAMLALFGAGLLAFGFYTASLPSIYRQSSFWTNSPAYFAIRAGVVLLTTAALHGLAAGLDLQWRPLQRLGRASLFVYWIHVQVVYGWATWPLHGRLRVWQTVVGFVVLSGLVYALIPLKDRLVDVWTTRHLDRNAHTAASV
jgi:uncharacterized membrane protein